MSDTPHDDGVFTAGSAEVGDDDVPDDPLHDDEAHRAWTERCEAVDRGDQCMHGLDHDGPHQAIHEWEDAVSEVDG